MKNNCFNRFFFFALLLLTFSVLLTPAFSDPSYPSYPIAPSALPVGGHIVSGTGVIHQSGNSMSVSQTTDKMITNWDSFNIGRDASVTFQQPGRSSIALNRIFNQNPSQIFGSLSADGQVFLLNPAGVYFGPTATVDVGGIVASTLNMSNENFLSGNYRFENSGIAGSIINKGQISSSDGGYVAFLSPVITNDGAITTLNGTTALAAGDKVSLDFIGDRLISFTLDKGAVDAQINSNGMVKADGGLVMMTAKAADELTKAVVNHTGIIEAGTIETRSGRILLLADGERSETMIGGTLDASAPDGGDGGFVETSAATVNIADSAFVTTRSETGKTGTWLIDPNDFTIAADGGDMTGAQVSTALDSNNFTISTATQGTSGGNGDIFVNDTVSWNEHTLTLNAERNIEINSPMNGSDTAKLALEYGQGAVAAGNNSTYSVNAPVNLPEGNNFSTKLGNDGVVNDYYVITELGAAGSTTGTDLQGMQGNLSGNYALGVNIDASETSTWNSGKGFVSIGDGSTYSDASRFTGKFDGLGHTISDLTINRTGTSYVGLFGYTKDAVISNVGITGGSITGSNTYFGGLVGMANGSTITNSYATADVTGNNCVGGLIGGISNSSTITNSYATGNVSGKEKIGGLVGQNNGTSVIENSYATGSVYGENDYVGGLVGENTGTGTIKNSYATGDVSGSNYVGGLVGRNTASTIENSYATGSVSGSNSAGGLVGQNYSGGKAINSFYDTDTTGMVDTGRGTPKTTAGMKSLATFTSAGWDIEDTGGTDSVWRIYDGDTYPLLRSFLTQLTLTPEFTGGGTYTNIAGYAGNNGVDSGKINTANAELTISSSNQADQATAILSGIVSVQNGYDISYDTKIFTTPGSSADNLLLTDSITWTEGRLNLKSGGSIVINAELTGSDNTSLVLQYGQSAVAEGNKSTYSVNAPVNLPQGDNFSTRLGNDGVFNNYYVITELGAAGSTTGTDLQGMQGNLSGNYVLGADINASATSGWNGNEGFEPIGNNSTRFTGKFDGLGHTISDLTINRFDKDYIGLFGYTKDAVISNVGITGVNVKGHNFVGGLVGLNKDSSITNSFVIGDVTGGDLYTGGLVGRNVGESDRSTIENSFAIGNVTGERYAGGLAGANFKSTITNSYANVKVTGENNSVGGLVGDNDGVGRIIDSYAAGDVTGKDNVGGLVGYMGNTGGISYIKNSYAVGKVTGTGSVGGLLGYNVGGTITDSFYDKNTTGRNDSYKGEGKTTAEMKSLANFTGWDIDNIGGTDKAWRIYDGDTYPLLRSFLTPLTVITDTSESKIYDGTTSVSVSSHSWDITPDESLVFGTASYVSESKNAGTHNLLLSGLYSNQQGYDISASSTNRVTITPKPITVTGVTANGKVYDAGTDVVINTNSAVITDGATTDGDNKYYTGDNITLVKDGVTAAFTDKAAEDNKSVTVSGFELSGADAGNYTVTDGSNATAKITAKAITITGITASDKTYDGDTAATVDTNGASGWIAGDSFIVTATGIFDDKNVGTGKTVSLTSTYTGDDVNNYDITDQATTTASISAKPITISGITASDKVYDATTTATTDVSNATGWISGDSFIVTATGTFDDKNVGTGKTVTLASTYTGADADNYTITDQATATANITAKAITITGITASDKTYDGDTDATVDTNGASGWISGDSFIVTATGTFDDKNVGTGKTVSLTSTYTGDDVNNYDITDQVSTDADITAKAITISGITASDKVYDGDTDATVDTNGASGWISGDSFIVTATGTFDDKNVGTGKTVSLASTYTGADAGNYTITDQATTTASISAKPITITGITASGKVYDADTTATTDVSNASGWIAGDDIGLSAAGTFDDRNVGTGKTVSLASTYTGADAGNYTITDQATTTASISAKPITISGITASDKVYDATTTATTDVSNATGWIAGDSFTVTATGTFDDKNVGTGKTVQLTSTYTGADKDNYTITDQATATANISKADLSVTGLSASNKIYDATTTAEITGTAAVTPLGTDNVTLDGTAVGAFDNKNVGTDKAVTVTGNSISGTDAGNYNLIQQTGLTADITRADLSVTGLSASSKIYDATADAALTGTAVVNPFGTDDVVLGGTAVGAFDNKNVGEDKAVTVTGNTISGIDAGNYNLIQQTGLTANITRADLSVAGLSASDKVYDATTVAALTGTAVVTPFGTDDVVLDGTAVGAFDNKNVGEDKAVTVTGNTISGIDAGNYNLVQQTGLAANITRADLSVAGLSASDKVYDATTVAALTGTAVVTPFGTDDVVLDGTAVGAFDNKNVGEDKAVTVTGNTISGTDAGNYNLVQQTGLTADITPASLIVTARDASKTYGQTLTFNGSEFTSEGLVGDEKIDHVLLASLGAHAEADISGSPYAIVVSDASGSEFLVTNYDVTYNDGSLIVNPKEQTTPVYNTDPVAQEIQKSRNEAGIITNRSPVTGSSSIIMPSVMNSGNVIITTASLVTPAAISTSGSTMTLSTGPVQPGEPMVETGVLPVFRKSTGASPELQGNFTVKENSSSISLEPDLSSDYRNGAISSAGLDQAESVPFALILENGIVLQMTASVTSDGVLIITSDSDFTEEVDVQKAVLVSIQVVKHKLQKLGDLKAVLFVGN